MQKLIPILFSFLMIAHLTSMAAMEIFSWSLFLVAIFDMIHRRVRFPFSDFPQFVNLSLWTYWGATILGSISQGASIHEVLRVAGQPRWILLLYIYSYLIKTRLHPRLERPLRWMFALVGLVAIYGLFQSLTGLDLTRSSNDKLKLMYGWYRSIGFFSKPLTYAYSIGLFASLALAYLTISKNYFWSIGRFVSSSTYLLSWLAILTTMVRGSWLALTGGSLALLFLTGRKAFLSGIAVLAFTLIVLVLVFPGFSERTATIVDPSEGSNAGRLELWQAHWEMFKDHPIFGVGMNRNSGLLEPYYTNMGIENGKIGHAHNDLIQVLSGSGIVGLIAYLIFCTYFLWLSWSLWKNLPSMAIWYRTLTFGILGSQILFHIGGLTQCNFTDSELNHVLIFFWAILVAIKYQMRHRTEFSTET